jgi:hypothetical protein
MINAAKLASSERRTFNQRSVANSMIDGVQRHYWKKVARNAYIPN